MASKSAAQIAKENVEVCKKLNAKQIKEKFESIFSNTLSRKNFIKVLYKNGIDFSKMDYMENSIEFTVKDKYSNGKDSKRRLHLRQINERDINDIYYPFCTKVFLKKKEIHIIPCEYGRFSQLTKNCEIIK